MRFWILALVAACSNVAADSCPTMQDGISGDVLVGTSCSMPADQSCFVLDQFSGCDSATYRCVGGKWRLDHGLDAIEGHACNGAPLAECSYEGNPGCTEPIAQQCSCGADGVWHCSCACYGEQAECGACPPQFPGTGMISFPRCADVGATCSYPGHTCTCTSEGTFDCT